MPRMRNLLRSAVVVLAGTTLLGATVTHTTTKVMFQGKPVEMVTLKNKNGMEVQAISYGGIITSIKVPDRAGKLADVVLGFDQSNQYFAEPTPPYFGAIVGRYGNRIAKGQFALDGKTYTLATNNGAESSARRQQGLRQGAVGGRDAGDAAKGRRRRSRAPARTAKKAIPATSPSRVTYTLTDKNELIVDYHATTDKPTRRQSDAAQLLQPRGRGLGRHPRPSADVQRRPLHAGGRHADPDRRAGAGRGHAVRLPPADRDRRADRPGQRAAEGRQGLRSQLGAEPEGRRACELAARADRSEERPHARDQHHRAGHAVLHRAISSTARSRARTATSTASAPASASRPSISPIRRITRPSRRPNCAPGRATIRRPSSRSAPSRPGLLGPADWRTDAIWRT